MPYSLDSLLSTRSPVKRPRDFDTFWDGVKAEIARTPLEWDRAPHEGLSSAKRRVDVIRFSSVGGATLHGWYAAPTDAVEPHSANGYLWLPGYSRGNPRPGPESLYPRTATFGLNVHGNPADTPYVHPSKTGDDYIVAGIESPETYIYRRIVAGCLIALDVLSRQPEVDPGRLFAGGMSQGGALALILSALRGDVRLCLADMPWLCDLDRALSLANLDRYRPNSRAGTPAPHPELEGGRPLRLPDARMRIAFYADEHPDVKDRVFETYRYFDPLSHADRIRCPVQMSAGGRDPSCRPPTIFSVYNEITADKDMLYLPDAGHQIVPDMHAEHLKWISCKLE